MNLPGLLDKATIDKDGGAEETRTPDFLRAREALSQLSYSPICQKHYIKQNTSFAIRPDHFTKLDKRKAM